ncbi:hypothetical protein FSP39_013252 [Pinctada imbricata]|uniref:RING-type domain-containing protein n=1 Tax=Pinctada imbricata TaxID=66713 RepID=A0AA89C1B9_PINIB|nr:hypothetical protein FSP39_013252 [Pinctada imbricata]
MALVVFVLFPKQLIDIYSYGISVAILGVSFKYNQNFVHPHDRGESSPSWPNSGAELEYFIKQHFDYFENVFIQSALAYSFTCIWRFRKPLNFYRHDELYLVPFGVFTSLYVPTILQLFFQGDTWNIYWPYLALIFPSLMLIVDAVYSVSAIYRFFKRAYTITRLTIDTIGIQVFIENQWIRLQIPKVLRLYYIQRIAVQSIYYYVKFADEQYHDSNIYSYYHLIDFTSLGKLIAIKSCDTTIALLGMTSIISFLAHYLGVFLAFCVGSDSDEDKNMGTVSAILFFILGLQTGLTGLRPDERLIRLCKNFCLLFTAISHFIHSMVHPLLMSLSASRSTNIKRHVRVLSMCAFLLTFPLCLLIYLWSNYSISTWLLAVTAFSIEVMLKVLVSLTVYTLFIFDAYREKFWEGLDDYVYYIQSTGNTIEFIFGIFLFCNGAWIMVFESGGAIRAVMMCIHAYFNIWMQAKEGWKVFMKRRTAVNKINSLPAASLEQLQDLNDVCAICYQELNSARITRCNHYFHGVCLRKWLYVQDNCPLCHELIYQPEDTQSQEAKQNNNHVPQHEPNQNVGQQVVEEDIDVALNNGNVEAPQVPPYDHTLRNRYQARRDRMNIADIQHPDVPIVNADVFQ